MRFLTLILALLHLVSADIALADVSIPSTVSQQQRGMDFGRSYYIYRPAGIYMPDTSGNTMLLKAPNLANDNTVFTLPPTNGTNGYVLKTDGTGVTSWAEDAGGITEVTDAEVTADAAIQRSKLADGTADHVVINDGDGVMSSEAALSPSRGGTGTQGYPENTIAIGGGAYSLQFDVIGNTTVNLPQSGTLATLASPETFSDKSFDTTLQMLDRKAIHFLEDASNGTEYIGLKAPSAITDPVVFTLPAEDGDEDDCLKTDGSAVLEWGPCSGGGATVPPSLGGTGIVNNDSATLKLATHPVEFITTGSTQLTLPTTGELVTADTTNTFTNKSVVDSSFSVIDSIAPTTTITFDAAGTSGTTTQLVSSQTSNRTITLPDATTTLLGTNNSAVVSNKVYQELALDDFSTTGVLIIKPSDGTISNNNDPELRINVGNNDRDLALLGNLSVVSSTTFLGSRGASVTLPEYGRVATVADNVVVAPSYTGGVWAASGAGVTVGDTTTSTDLPGVGPTAIKITPVSGTAYGYYRWTQPASYKNRKLGITWDQRPLSGYASGDLKLEVYKHSDTGTCTYSGGSYTEYSLSTDNISGDSGIPNLTGRFTSSFDTDNADCYELRIVRTAGTTALNIQSVKVGPDPVLNTYAGGEIGSIGTITFTWNTHSGATVTNVGRRDGEWLELDVVIILGSGGTISGNPTITVPTEYAADTSTPGYVADGSANYSYLCEGRVEDVSANVRYKVSCQHSSSTVFWLMYDNGTTTETFVSGSAPIASPAAGDAFHLKLKYRVAKWVGSSSIMAATNDCEYAYNTDTTTSNDTTSFGYGPTGQVYGSFTSNTTGVTNKRVRFTTPIQSTDDITLQHQPLGANTNSGWLNASEYIPFTYANTSRFGLGYTQVSGSSTDIDVAFGKGGATSTGSATYAATNGDPWSGYASAGSKWRVRKCSAGRLTGAPLAGEKMAGLISREFADKFSTTWQDNGTSPGTSGSTDVELQRLGKFIFAYIPAFSLTTGSGTPNTITAQTAMPTWARPSTNQRVWNGQILGAGSTLDETPQWVVQTNGVIILRRDAGGSGFGASGTAGLGEATIISWYAP